MSRRMFLPIVAAVALVALAIPAGSTAVAKPKPANPLSKINHIVVIYEENHSFDNLYGGWEGVNGLRNADAARHGPGRTRAARRTTACSRTT